MGDDWELVLGVRLKLDTASRENLEWLLDEDDPRPSPPHADDHPLWRHESLRGMLSGRGVATSGRGPSLRGMPEYYGENVYDLHVWTTVRDGTLTERLLDWLSPRVDEEGATRDQVLGWRSWQGQSVVFPEVVLYRQKARRIQVVTAVPSAGFLL